MQEMDVICFLSALQFRRPHQVPTQPAFAIPVKMFPAIMSVILCAEPEMHDPTTPSRAPHTRNHFFPNRSPREPWTNQSIPLQLRTVELTKIGPAAKTTRKFPLAIQEASAASAGDLATVETWNLIVVLVYRVSVGQLISVRQLTVFARAAQTLPIERVITQSMVRHPSW
jgi:hypothetical protein